MKLFTAILAVFPAVLLAQTESMGTMANSPYEELAPYVTPDGGKIFFIRESHPNNTNFGESQDIWWCSLADDRAVSEAKHLGFPFNTLNKNALCYQSPDGQTRVIKGVLDNAGKFKRSGYSVSRLTAKGWSDPEAIDIKGYDNMVRGKYVSMCMAPGGNVMILSFSEEKDSPHSELYMSRYAGGNDWTKPKKLGFTVPGDFGAFVAADGETMYFSGVRDGGYGNADIYVVHRKDDTWLSWTEPENMGPQINTGSWDAYFIVSPTAKNAFVISDRDGSSDLYRFSLEKIKEEAKPAPVIIVEGRVLDAETGKPLAASLEYFNLSENTSQGIGRSSIADGSYKVVLPYGQNFAVNAQLKGYYAEALNLDLSGTGEFATVKKDILLRPIKMESVIRLNNLFFETGRFELLPTSRTELDALSAMLVQNPSMKIEIRGHTDNVGTDDSNTALSDDRARSVVNYLLEKGISADRLTSKGYGETIPVAGNDTPEGRQLNRRVEFKVQAL
jgi:OmpA-OmpF porin, OOP family